MDRFPIVNYYYNDDYDHQRHAYDEDNIRDNIIYYVQVVEATTIIVAAIVSTFLYYSF